MEIDFTVDESLMTDRTNSQWTTSKAEMDEFWRKRLKSTLLNLKLAGKDIADAKETLLNRYKNQLTRVEQTNPEDVFRVTRTRLPSSLTRTPSTFHHGALRTSISI